MPFGLYLLSAALIVIGVAYGATIADVPGHWIAVGAIILFGVAAMAGVSRSGMGDAG